MIEFSVIMPSFNQEAFIGRAVQSVLDQKGVDGIELLVMDGGSTDGTVELLKGFGDRITWVSEKDRGQSDAVNKGIRRARGRFLAWLNSDDILYPGALSKAAAFFKAHPETMWIYGRCNIIDGEDREVRRWITRYKNLLLRNFRYEKLLVENFLITIAARNPD